jgi:hypothetical protein
VVISLIPSIHAASEGTGLPEAVDHDASALGHEIPGLSFRVFVDRGVEGAAHGVLDEAQAGAALRTVVDAFSYLNLGIPRSLLRGSFIFFENLTETK